MAVFRIYLDYQLYCLKVIEFFIIYMQGIEMRINMENTRLVMLEGLPGTGKSTNSYFLSMQLGRNGKTVKWIHEVARPHPVLFFSEASLTYDEYNSILESKPILNRIAVFRKTQLELTCLNLNGII